MPVLPASHIIADRLQDNLNRRKLQNGSGAAIAANEIVAIDTLSNAEAHLNVKKALADGTHLQTGLLYIATQKAPTYASTDRGNKGDKFWGVRTAVIAMDTSAGTRGDPVYLSTAVAGGVTLTKPADLLVRQVGQVLVAATVANGGYILVDLDNYGTGGLASAVGNQYTVIETQVTLADLPAATTSGIVVMGTVDASRPVIGAFIKLNADPDVGASGVTALDLSFAYGTDNLCVTLDIFGETGSPKFYSSLTNPSEFNTLPHVVNATATAVYSIDATGGNLSAMTAFDVTFYILVANQEL
jgi:hypothetical protein